MDIMLTEAKDVVTVRLKGRLTTKEAPKFGSAMDDQLNARKRLVLDLGDLNFIDSTGIGMVVLVGQHARDAGVGPVMIRNAQVPVRRMLAIVQLDSMDEFHIEG